MKRSQKIQAQRIVREKFENQRRIPQLHPKTPNQKLLIDRMKDTKLVVADAPAGCGKSLLACWWAASQFLNHKAKKIVLLRAYQPLAGRSIGFRKGDQQEKLHAFYIQLLEYLEDFMGKGAVEVALRNGELELGDLEAIRGRSWDDGTIIICDEFQNMFVSEVQAIVTRVGEGSQLICLGDDTGFQSDVTRGMNGLAYLKSILEKYTIQDACVVKFDEDDIVRSGMVKDFVVAFMKEMEGGKK